MGNSTSLDALADLVQLSIKFLGRTAVQRQLIAIVAILLAAWLLSRLILWLVDRRKPDVSDPLLGAPLLEPAETVELAPVLTEATAGDEDAEDAEGAPAPYEEPAPVPTRSWFQRLRDGARAVSRLLLMPVLALGLGYGVRAWFQQQNWFAGLLNDLLVFLWWFLLYRIMVGVLYAWMEPSVARRHHRRLFTPLLVTTVLLAVLGKLTQLDLLRDLVPFSRLAPTITLGALAVATVGFYFWIAFTELLQDLLQPILASRRGNPGAVQASLTLWRYAMIAVGLFVVFRVLGLDPTTVAAITGGLSIGVGLALQDVLKNFLGGIILLFEGTVRPGDWVEIGGTEGAVDKLSIRSTVVRTFDNVEYIVPNQDWLNSTVTTYTRNDRRVRARVPIGVSYASDVRQVQELLVETAMQHPDVLHDPPPVAPLVNFGESSLDFWVLVWVDDAVYKGKVAGELRLMIWDVFAEHGIEIPFPQRDLHIRSGLPPAWGQTQNGPDDMAQIALVRQQVDDGAN
jgi:small-conductance mechanosensitive channel